jgi:multidrug resistance efflux pump
MSDELAAAYERIADLERQRAVWQEHFDHIAMRIAEARNAVLEEAALIADEYASESWGMTEEEAAANNLAALIRALKDKPAVTHGVDGVTL